MTQWRVLRERSVFGSLRASTNGPHTAHHGFTSKCVTAISSVFMCLDFSFKSNFYFNMSLRLMQCNRCLFDAMEMMRKVMMPIWQHFYVADNDNSSRSDVSLFSGDMYSTHLILIQWEEVWLWIHGSKIPGKRCGTNPFSPEPTNVHVSYHASFTYSKDFKWSIPEV